MLQKINWELNLYGEFIYEGNIYNICKGFSLYMYIKSLYRFNSQQLAFEALVRKEHRDGKIYTFCGIYRPHLAV